MSRAELSKIHTKIFEAATEVHTLMGPGLPAKVYKTCIQHELRIKNLMFRKEVLFPAIYKDYKAGELIVETLIENSTILEIISDPLITPLHIAALQSKLKITKLRMGIIITFNTLNMIEGYRKITINP